MTLALALLELQLALAKQRLNDDDFQKQILRILIRRIGVQSRVIADLIKQIQDSNPLGGDELTDLALIIEGDDAIGEDLKRLLDRLDSHQDQSAAHLAEISARVQRLIERGGSLENGSDTVQERLSHIPQETGFYQNLFHFSPKRFCAIRSRLEGHFGSFDSLQP